MSMLYSGIPNCTELLVLNNYMQVVTESTLISFWLTGPSIYLQTSESGDDCAKCGYYNIFQ